MLRLAAMFRTAVFASVATFAEESWLFARVSVECFGASTVSTAGLVVSAVPPAGAAAAAGASVALAFAVSAALTVAVSAVACVAGEDRPVQTGGVAEYACGESMVRVEYRADSAFVTLTDTSLALPLAISASGARYSDGVSTAWEHQGTLDLEVPGRALHACGRVSSIPIEE